MNIFNIIINLVIFTILFIILMFVFNWGENFVRMFENVFILNWFGRYFWNIFIPWFIADLSIFIWLVIEYIRFDPKEDVTTDD